MNLVRVSPDLGEVKLLHFFKLNLSRCPLQGLFMKYLSYPWVTHNHMIQSMYILCDH